MRPTEAQKELLNLIEDTIGRWPHDHTIEAAWWFIRKYLPEARHAEKHYLMYGQDELEEHCSCDDKGDDDHEDSPEHQRFLAYAWDAQENHQRFEEQQRLVDREENRAKVAHLNYQ